MSATDAGHRRLATIVTALIVALTTLTVSAPSEAAVDPDPCGALHHIGHLLGAELCTHGPDPHPAGTHAEDPGAGVDRAEEPVPVAPISCVGDGADGTRVEVLYVRGASTPSRRAALDDELRRWTEQVEWTVVASAAATGGRRSVRWVTEPIPAGCRVVVTEVALHDDALATLGHTIQGLARLGYDRSDRKYLLFVESDVYCGIATTTTDDRPAPDNVADRQVGYARVDRPCWTTGDDGFLSTAAHELFHTLGAVQPSSPSGTDGRHCSDEWDLMCYADAAGVRVEVRCADDRDGTLGQGDINNRLLDCGGDDYFRVPARADSWLADHWNTADSLFLTGGEQLHSEPAGMDEVEADPKGRPMRWPTSDLGGPHRPLVSDGFGWESCDLPILVTIEGQDAASTGGVLGLVAGEEPADKELERLVQGAIDEVNAGVRGTVLRIDEAGPLSVRWGDVAGTSHVAVTTEDARIVAGTLTLDRTALAARSDDLRATLTLQALAQALGIGRSGGTVGVMAPWPTADASRETLFASLRHLYATGCTFDPRLDDTAGGHRSQRYAAGVRERLDIGSGASDGAAVAIQVSRQLRRVRGEQAAPLAVLCRDDIFADCLGGAALAGRSGLVLFVPGGPDGALPDPVADELHRAVEMGGQVVILGGTGAVSRSIEDDLRTRVAGRTVRRIAGVDRIATAALVAAEVSETHGADQVVVARADVAADAVAVGAAVASKGLPVLLTGKDRLPEASLALLRSLRPTSVHVIGGGAAVTDAVLAQLATSGASVRRLAGRTRSETSVAIARGVGLWDRRTVGASGSVIGVEGWHPDGWTVALAAAPLGAVYDAPILYLSRSGLPSAAPTGSYPGDVLEYLRDTAIQPTASGPRVRTIVVGKGAFVPASVAEAFHGTTLPGWDGNATVTRR